MFEDGKGARGGAELLRAFGLPRGRLELAHGAPWRRRSCGPFVKKSKIGTHESPMGHLTSV